MPYNPSKLFNQSGYVLLRDYLEDIRHMKQYGPWKLPLYGWRDYVQIALLSFVSRYSWFRENLSVINPFHWSPAYSFLLTILQKENFFDTLRERQIPNRKLYSYLFTKNVVGKDGSKIKIFGQGTAQDRATALSKAIGEIIERRVTGYLNEDSSGVQATPDWLLRKAIPMVYTPRFHRFLPTQIERHENLKYNPKRTIEWVFGTNLITGEKTYIPRMIAQYGHPLSQKKQPDAFIQDPTSNGSAGYFTKEGAILRGLLEVVHRDAFLVHWLTKVAPNRIHLETLSEDIKSSLSELKSRGITIYLLEITAIPIPSVVAVAINEQAAIPRVVMSGAAATTYRDAILSAIEETSVVTWRFEKDSERECSSKIDPEPFVSQLDQYGRLDYWQGHQRVAQFQWFLSGPLVGFPDICKKDLTHVMDDHIRLKHCLKILKSHGKDYFPIAYFPRHYLLKKIGYVVAQVFIPKAFPFYMEEYLGTFDSDRLDEFALTHGKIDWVLNPDPHMFS